ncbi:MAG TPA: sensor histidine kinase [Vicinamibacterales bacterium]|nr:sensor histidine kinase [Vicinamibacterales bacterium]
MSLDTPCRRLTTGLLVWAAWSAIAIFFAISTALTYVSQGRPPLWLFNFGTAIAQWSIWALLTPVVFWIGRRWPLARGHLLTRIPLHVVLGVLVAFVKIAIEGRVRVWVFGVPPYALISNVALQIFIYWALVAASHGLAWYTQAEARAIEMESQLNAARLKHLRAQLQPHFLFNALNAIAELIHEDPDRADRMIGRLGDLLRASLDAGDRTDATLEDEIALARDYLTIQEARFGERLRASIDVAAECANVLVPPLLLQPIVENAVMHGVAPKREGGTVAISARRAGDRLEVRIDDDGPGVAADAADGIGLSTTRARLQALGHPAAVLAISSRPGGGTRAVITLPWRQR